LICIVGDLDDDVNEVTGSEGDRRRPKSPLSLNFLFAKQHDTHEGVVI